MQRTVLEICAGAGGQACGLERAGFDHQAAVDIEDACTDTLRLNRPRWNVVTSDIREVDGRDYRGVDLLAGGVPCSPFSIAGKQLGADDERDLFPETVRIIREARPTAIMLENVPAFASARFDGYRVSMLLKLERLDYLPAWKVLNASAFGVPQLRPRFVLVAVQRHSFNGWQWPPISYRTPPTVGEALEDLMAARGWPGAHRWAQHANGVGPTIVGGSKKGSRHHPARKQRLGSRSGNGSVRCRSWSPAPGGWVGGGDVACDGLGSGAGVALEGPDGGVPGPGEQHRGAGAVFGLVGEKAVPELVEGPAWRQPRRRTHTGQTRPERAALRPGKTHAAKAAPASHWDASQRTFPPADPDDLRATAHAIHP
jgi:DNA (cytosine-5)-methyltransferase 1